MGEVLSQHKMGKVLSQHKLELKERGRRGSQSQSSSLLHERSGPIVGEPGCRMLVMAIAASVVKAVLALLHIVLLLLPLLGVGLVTMTT